MSSYIFRNQYPQPLGQPPPKRISTPAGQRLSTITEGPPDSNLQRQGRRAIFSSRLQNTPFARRYFGSTSSRDAAPETEKNPPAYSSQPPPASRRSALFTGSVWSASSTYSGDEPLQASPTPSPGIGDRVFGQRGGWKRVIVFLVIIVVVIIALAVGLGVGLTRKNNSSNSKSGSGSSNSPQSFPLGTWTLDTFLTNTSTSCTADPSTWQCDPLQLYPSPTSAYAFTWTISSSSHPPSNSTLLISAMNNPLALTFPNTTLILQSPGTPNEHYAFNLTMSKTSITPSLNDNPASDRCYFNSTILSATLYTQMARQIPNDANATNVWPAAVNIMQTSPGGANVPDCYPLLGNTIAGPRITGIAPQPESSMCECMYEA